MNVAKRILSLFRKKKADHQQNANNVKKGISWIFNAGNASILRICFESEELVFKVAGVKHTEGKFKIEDCLTLGEEEYTRIEHDFERILTAEFNVIDMDLSNLDMEEDGNMEDNWMSHFDFLRQRPITTALKCRVFRVLVNEKHKYKLNDILPLFAFETLHLRNSFSQQYLSELILNKNVKNLCCRRLTSLSGGLSSLSRFEMVTMYLESFDGVHAYLNNILKELKENPGKSDRLRLFMLRRRQVDGIGNFPGIKKYFTTNYRLAVEGALVHLVCDADGFDLHICAPNTLPKVTPTTYFGTFY